MIGLILQEAAIKDLGIGAAGGAAGGALALIAAFLAIFAIIGIALYIYLSFVFMAIAKKLKQSSPGIAWIPGIGPLIITWRASKMHWWPWLLFAGIIIPIINIIAGIILGVFAIIWMWKTFEAIKRPGWWALIPVIASVAIIIPVIGIILYPVGMIFYFVSLGIAAWGK